MIDLEAMYEKETGREARDKDRSYNARHGDTVPCSAYVEWLEEKLTEFLEKPDEATQR